MTGKNKIELILAELDIKAPTFASNIGVKYQRILDIQIGKTKKISGEVAAAIVAHYPQFKNKWLLTGEGSMLVGDKPLAPSEVAATGKLIPFYDADAAAGYEYGMDMDTVRQAGVIEIGTILRDSESAIRVYGNSMVPNYPAGCVIGLKAHKDNLIEPGSVYVIETRDNRYIKRLYYTDDKSSFHCLSDNQMKYEDGARKGKLYYQDFEIPIQDVIRLYRVVGVVKRNIL